MVPAITDALHALLVARADALINVSTVMAGQRLGLEEVDDGILEQKSWNRKPCNLSTTRSVPACHPCLRYNPLPMSPGRTLLMLAETEGFEPSIRLDSV